MISSLEQQPAGNGNKPTKKNVVPAVIADTDDFKQLVNLLAIYSDADNRLAKLEADVNESVLEIIDGEKADYAKLQQARTEAEGGLELLARKHPEWFVSAKTLKTLYGAVSLKDNPPKLNVPNPEVSIVLIQQKGEKEKSFQADKYLRTHTELDLEELAKLNDDELKAFRITRTQSDTFSVKPTKLDLGKAMKPSAEKESK